MSPGCSFERRTWKLGFLKLTALGPEFTYISHQGRQRKQRVGTIQPGTDTVRDAVNGGKDRRRGLGTEREAGRQLRRGGRNNGGKGKKGGPNPASIGMECAEGSPAFLASWSPQEGAVTLPPALIRSASSPEGSHYFISHVYIRKKRISPSLPLPFASFPLPITGLSPASLPRQEGQTPCPR